MSKLEEAAKVAARQEQAVIRLPIKYVENQSEEDAYRDRLARNTEACRAMFVEGAKWLLEEAEKLKRPEAPHPEYGPWIFFNDLKKLTEGE